MEWLVFAAIVGIVGAVLTAAALRKYVRKKLVRDDVFNVEYIKVDFIHKSLMSGYHVFLDCIDDEGDLVDCFDVKAKKIDSDEIYEGNILYM